MASNKRDFYILITIGNSVMVSELIQGLILQKKVLKKLFQLYRMLLSQKAHMTIKNYILELILTLPNHLV